LFCRILRSGLGGQLCGFGACGESSIQAFGLQAAKLLKGAMEGALRGGAGAVDGGLKAVEFFVAQIIRRGDFEIGAAAEAPCGMDDFAGERLLERRVGRQFGEIAGLEFIEDVTLFGADEIRDREQSKFRRILRDAGAAFGRDRAVGPFSVLPIGQDLGGSSHGSATIAWSFVGELPSD